MSIRRHKHDQQHHASAAAVTDPVCGMAISPDAGADSETVDGVTYYFCSDRCAAGFRADPHRYTARDRS